MTWLKKYVYYGLLLFAILLVGGCQEPLTGNDASEVLDSSVVVATEDENLHNANSSDTSVIDEQQQDRTSGAQSTTGDSSNQRSEHEESSSNQGHDHNGNSTDPSHHQGNKSPESSVDSAENRDLLQVHYIDVGQGAAQLLIGPTGKTMLIDAGDNHQEQFIVDYLRQQGISKIDILIGTHPHADHIGGLDAVIQAFDIGRIYMPRFQANTRTFEDVLLAVQEKGLTINRAKAGIDLDWEAGIDVKMVAPIRDYNNANEMSVVVHVRYGETAFIFTGDAEAESESDMVQSTADLSADVLHVPHHGSSTSTSPAFLERVNPTYAVIQSGAENRYGHPHREVLQRLEEHGALIYRNDEQGHIIFTSDGHELAVILESGEAVTTQSSSNAKEFTVSAKISDSTPKQNSTLQVTVTVQDSDGNPVQGADIELKLHYKTTTTIYEGRTKADGTAILSFRIGRAAKDFTVHGDIFVEFGEQSGEAQVSFTPQ